MASEQGWRKRLLERQQWVIFLLPYLLFMVVTSLEPTPDKPGGGSLGLAIPYDYYPLIYAIKIALVAVGVAFVWPGYRQFPFRLTLLGVLVGIVGGPLWIGLCHLDIEHVYLQPLLERINLGWLIGAGLRSGFNPFAQMAQPPGLAWGFLIVRFAGLVLLVPLIEEFFLRGFVMRFVMDRDWWKIPFGQVNGLAIAIGTLLPMFAHPGELIAAAVWFSMITWLMVRTRSIWDCVVAHAITNLILGLYVVLQGGDAWRLM